MLGCMILSYLLSGSHTTPLKSFHISTIYLHVPMQVITIIVIFEMFNVVYMFRIIFYEIKPTAICVVLIGIVK